MRKPRVLVDGGRYHVVARANRGEFLLQPESMKEEFVRTLERAKAKFSFGLEMFCVMDNHFHLVVVTTGGESLSRLMQWILSVFAMRYNRMHRLKGHVWYDRFKSRVITSLRQYLATMEYVVRNPVKAGIVANVSEYRWSGFRWWRFPRQELIEPPSPLLRLRFGYLCPLQLSG